MQKKKQNNEGDIKLNFETSEGLPSKPPSPGYGPGCSPKNYDTEK